MRNNYRSKARIVPCPFAAGAFTLVELLVSMAVLGVMMLVLMQTTSTTLDIWRSSERKIASSREGRTATFFLQEDLKGMLVPRAEGLRPRVDQNSLRFLTTKTVEYQDQRTVANTGDLCTVEYRMDPESALLQRGYLDSRPTFEAISGSAPSLPEPPEDSFEMVATNVYDFEARGVAADGTAATGLPKFIEMMFNIAPSKDALENIRRGGGLAEQQERVVERVAIRAPVPDPS